MNEVKLLAQKLTVHPGTIALLGIAGEKAQLLFGRAENVEADMSALLKTALSAIGSARGGGRSSFAQGGGVPADVEQLLAAIQQAVRALNIA